MPIQFEQVSYRHLPGTLLERSALSDLSLLIQDGGCTVIAGCSGSGKSTLLQLLHGLIQPSGGRVLLDGAEPGTNATQRSTGLVFQYPEQQIFAASVYQEVALGLETQGLSAAAVRERVIETVRAVGLDPGCLEQSPFRLSGGERRKVAIAGVLVTSPRILMLDEPLAGLDPDGRRNLLGLLDRLRSDSAMTLLIASHSLEDLAQIADRLVLLAGGRVIAEGAARDLTGNTAALEAAGLAAPSIRGLMTRLKTSIPELEDRVLTVGEAHRSIAACLAARKNGATAC